MLDNCCNQRPVEPFAALHQTPVIPKMYWDVYSAEERIKNMCCMFDKIIDYINNLGIAINKTDVDVAELQALFQQFIESGFDDYYADQVAQWIEDNLEYVINHIIRQVFFGLTLDGHLVAYIPESWNDIVFDTGMVYGTPEYGRLILSMQVDGEFLAVEQP